MGVKNYKETKVYKLSFEQAMDVFETSKLFPREEIYSLTDQVRRSSRSVCANLGESFIIKKCIQVILFQKYRTAILKTRKQMCGSIFLWLENTLHKKNMGK